MKSEPPTEGGLTSVRFSGTVCWCGLVGCERVKCRRNHGVLEKCSRDPVLFVMFYFVFKSEDYWTFFTCLTFFK